MRAKSMVLILIALGCGLVASIAISQVMDRGKNGGNGEVETVQIYVAANDIDVNEQLSAENVRLEDWPKSKIPEGSLVDLKNINEQFARSRMYEGEPILRRKLAVEISGPAVKIPEGHRVCSLSVRMDTAVSGLIKPGDQVDIYGYFRASNDIPKTGTREILRNVRVFAVNSETEQETDNDGSVIVAKTISVLVKQEQVAKLMLAAELGTLRLVLRRPNDDPESALTETATVESLFGSQAENADEDHSPSTRNTPKETGGFMKFLAGLNNGSHQSTPTKGTPVSVVEEPAGPAWEMMIMTPDGGTRFTWEEEGTLPDETSANQPSTTRTGSPSGSSSTESWALGNPSRSSKIGQDTKGNTEPDGTGSDGQNDGQGDGD